MHSGIIAGGILRSLEVIMRKAIAVLGFLGVLAVQSVGADTIYLKNGSIIKGKVASYADDQFVVVLNTGSDRASRAQIYKDDVARIEFDTSGGIATTVSPQDSGPTGPPTRTVVVEPPPKSEPTGASPSTPANNSK